MASSSKACGKGSREHKNCAKCLKDKNARKPGKGCGNIVVSGKETVQEESYELSCLGPSRAAEREYTDGVRDV